MFMEEKIMSEEPATYGRMTPEERYHRDPQFKMLVDTLELHIHRAQFTPTELREAAILAAIKYECRTVRPLRIY
jgi:hypothetical protein